MKITRRQFVAGGIAGAAITSVLGGSYWLRSKTNKPNIILLLADDMRYDAIGVHKQSFIQTPFLDSIKDQCAHWSNHFVTTSICPVSRASIVLGQYAHTHGIWDFDTDISEAQFAQSLPATLKDAGYYTGFIGKWGVGKRLFKKKFDYYDGFGGQGEYTNEQSSMHLMDRQTQSAIHFLKEAGRTDKPFFLQLSYKAPHGPFIPQKKFSDLYADIELPKAKTDTPEFFDRVPELLKNSKNRALYDEMSAKGMEEEKRNYYRLVTGIDDSIQQISSNLKELGLYDDTCLMITSDNGLMLGEHGLFGKWCMYEESIRLPLMVKPSVSMQLKPGIYDNISLNIDLAPTLLSIAKSDMPKTIEGVNLLKIQNDPQTSRTEFFYEYRLSNEGELVPCAGIYTTHWKYTEYRYNNKVEAVLFNLEKDPDEIENVAAKEEHKSLVIELQQKLSGYLT